jgi:hypothetical protein
MVDTGDLKSPALMSVRVRVPPLLPVYRASRVLREASYD